MKAIGRGILVITFVVIGVGIFSGGDNNKSASAAAARCSTDDLPYTQMIKNQIVELCEFGLSRSEAIEGIREVLRYPNINPAAAARLVKTGKNLDALKRDPLLLHKQ